MKIKPQKFKYKSPNRLVDIFTLSPSGMYYYKVQRPKQLNPSAFGCKIAFYNTDDNLIYFGKEKFAHELRSKEEIQKERKAMEMNEEYTPNNKSIEIVKWSKEGNVAYFLEYSLWNHEASYDSVFLNLKERYCYRINELIDKFQFVDGLNLQDKVYSESIAWEKLKNMKFVPEEVIKDNVRQGLFSNTKWYP